MQARARACDRAPEGSPSFVAKHSYSITLNPIKSALGKGVRRTTPRGSPDNRRGFAGQPVRFAGHPQGPSKGPNGQGLGAPQPSKWTGRSPNGQGLGAPNGQGCLGLVAKVWGPPNPPNGQGGLQTNTSKLKWTVGPPNLRTGRSPNGQGLGARAVSKLGANPPNRQGGLQMDKGWGPPTLHDLRAPNPSPKIGKSMAFGPEHTPNAKPKM